MIDCNPPIVKLLYIKICLFPSLYQVQRLQEDHVKAIAQKDESDAAHRLEIQRLQEQDRRLAQDLARAQEQNATLVEDNRSLASQLVLYQDDAKATSEMLIIKDAEVIHDCFCSKTFFRIIKNSEGRVY